MASRDKGRDGGRADIDFSGAQQTIRPINFRESGAGTLNVAALPLSHIIDSLSDA